MFCFTSCLDHSFVVSLIKNYHIVFVVVQLSYFVQGSTRTVAHDLDMYERILRVSSIFLVMMPDFHEFKM